MSSCQTPTTERSWPTSHLASRKLLIPAFFICAAIFSSQPARAQFVLQAELPILGNFNVVSAAFGSSVALSNDGNTAIVGAPGTNSGVGAAWVFTRSGNNNWITQAVLTPVGPNGVADAIGAAAFGNSVALSSDGNTAIVGGQNDNSFAGAVWRFTRSGGVWTPQGKLTVSDESSMAAFGYSVALSGDGNTAVIAGPTDKSGPGAVWFFNWGGSAWTGETKIPGHVLSVAMSGDGNTALVGTGNGGAWVYTRSGGTWTKQSPELTANNASTSASEGLAVALSGDGNTAILGGISDSQGLGAAWVFTRDQDVQQKLVGSGAVIPGLVGQGYSVALSADGNTALVGGPYDNSQVGATWAYTQGTGNFSQLGNKILFNTPTAPPGCNQGNAVALSADGGTAIIGGPGDGVDCTIGSAYVYVRPAIAISATPSTITAGQPTTLTWSTTDTANTCQASGAWNGSKTTPNTQQVTPQGSGIYGYTLTCDVAGPANSGSTSNTAFVIVTAVPVVPFNNPFCNLTCIERLLGAAGTAKPYGQTATDADGVLVLTRSGSITAMDVRHERGHDITTITVSPDSTVIVTADLGNDVRIVKAAADPSKFFDQLRTGVFGSAPWIKLAAGKPDAKSKIVGAAFHKGTLGGLIVTGATPP